MVYFPGALASACLAVSVAACADPPTAARLIAHDLPGASASLVPLDHFGIGSGGRGNACRAAEYRQFDFWVGNWDIYNTGNAKVGSSIVTSVVGGCAILENYLGGAGRSMSTYDEATKKWNQFYVFAQAGVLLLRGEFRRDSMVLEERRGPVINDVWAWTRISDDSVRQHERVFANGNLIGGFNGLYVRTAQPTVLPAPPATTCASGNFRQMDFLLGEWKVYEGSASGAGTAQGTLVARTGAGDCLVEETITGPAGFEGLSYASYHPQAARWFREYIDTDGRYLRLSGRLEGTRLVLTGNRIGANGALVVVRVSWEPVSADRVSQRWEFSLDGGASWLAERDYTFVKQ